MTAAGQWCWRVVSPTLACVCSPGSSTSSLVPGPEPGPQPALHIQAQVNNSNNKKGTFTDDLHKLVDNWARDAMSFSGRRGSKGHVSYEVSATLVFPPACPSVAGHGDPAVTTSRGF